MWNKIFGAISVIWGSLIPLNWFTADMPGEPNAYQPNAYQNGHSAAAVFGAVMFAAGLYYFFKKPGQA